MRLSSVVWGDSGLLFAATLETVLGKASRTEQVVGIQVNRRWRVVLRCRGSEERRNVALQLNCFNYLRTANGEVVRDTVLTFREDPQGSRVSDGGGDEADLLNDLLKLSAFNVMSSWCPWWT